MTVIADDVILSTLVDKGICFSIPLDSDPHSHTHKHNCSKWIGVSLTLVLGSKKQIHPEDLFILVGLSCECQLFPFADFNFIVTFLRTAVETSSGSFVFKIYMISS